MKVLVLEGQLVVQDRSTLSRNTITILNPSPVSVAFTKKAIGRNLDIEVICETSGKSNRFNGYVESIATKVSNNSTVALRVNTQPLRNYND